MPPVEHNGQPKALDRVGSLSSEVFDEAGSLAGRVDGTELAADAVELHPDHLPVTDTAGEHVEQDAAIKHPGHQ